MSTVNENVQDEISIREYIEIIWKGKVIIAIITAAAILLGVIASFFILKPEYESQASLVVSPISIQLSALNESVSIVDYLKALPVMAKTNYVQKIKSSQVLKATIDELELKDSDGSSISAASLGSAITVTDFEKTNVVVITVTYGDAEKAALIANTLCRVYAEVVAADYGAQIKEVAAKIEQQVSDSEAALIEKQKALVEYQKNKSNIDVLKGEIANLVLQIVEYKNNMQELETLIAADTSTLTILENASQSTDIIPSEDYNLSISTEANVETDIGTSANNQILLDPNSLQDGLMTIEINNIQIRLLERQNRWQALEDRMPELETTLNESQTLLAADEYKYNSVKTDLDTAQLVYYAYQQRNREVVENTTSNIGNTIISVTSEATPPDGPVSPNKKRNIAVAGMVGLCLGVVYVLFRNYWRRTKASSPK